MTATIEVDDDLFYPAHVDESKQENGTRCAPYIFSDPLG
jgi:hypothetical protein